jgi:homoserine O-acetyltransferase
VSVRVKTARDASWSLPFLRRPALELSVPVNWSCPEARANLPARVRAAVAGRKDAPLLVHLGGISANAEPATDVRGRPGWWSGLFSSRDGLDLAKWRVLSIDFAADDLGYFAPTPFDQAEALQAALAAIGETAPNAVIGASYGGMVAMAWAGRHAGPGTQFVIISADAEPHPMATATRSLQRRIVRLGRDHDCAVEALNIARGLSMLSYRTPGEFADRFRGGTVGSDPLGPSEPGSYLSARGEAFTRLMSPGRFLSLSASIDRHRVDVSTIGNSTLLVAVEEDQLVPPDQMRGMVGQWGGDHQLHVIRSVYGHDAFLKEAPLLSGLINKFLGSN